MSPAAAANAAAYVDDDASNKKAKISNVVSHKEWIKARQELLLAEKELSKQKAAVAQKRQEMPWEEVKEDYTFETASRGNNANGKGGSTRTVKLSELCGDDDEDNDSGTLVVWHFMFAGGDNGCHLCSFFLDAFNGIYPHLKPRTNFCAVALASPEEIEKLRRKKGWDFPIVSSRQNSFQRDYGVHWTQEELENGTAVYNYNQQWKYGRMAPGLSVFKKDQVSGKVYHTYSTYAAGLADLNATFAVLDITPDGRSEEGQNNMWWVKHKEKY